MLSLRWLRRRRELCELLSALRALDKGLFLTVTNATGDRFNERSLRTVLRKRHGQNTKDASLLDLARLLVRLSPRKKLKRLRHAAVRQAIDGAWLQEKLESMVKAYVQQTLDYGPRSRYGANWKISCYLVVMEKWKPKIEAHAPMVEVFGDVMYRCLFTFEQWYASQFSFQKFTIMNCFLTKYDASKQDETKLDKHVDGANVDASVILACPTNDPFQGGSLRVWDPDLFEYDDLRSGDCVFLVGRLWHQALPISKGTRYALVLFLKKKKKKSTAEEQNTGGGGPDKKRRQEEER